ncbi:MAG: molecular chaperone HtpG, partial [Gammaproteobacteria bacterium]|nr:molecular chaperone HtpG [Gammaproteobacteria bacterium]
RYSDHIAFPVHMAKAGEATLDTEVVNQAQALWTRPRTDITDDEYKQFYQHIAHDFADPLAWRHNRVEGKREYTSLLYIPSRAPFDPFRLRSLIRRYSDHIGFPVRMRKEGEASLEYEVVNQAKALWTLPRSEIKDEDYKQFYQYVAHDFVDPLTWSHNKVEGKREYTSLLYVPSRAPFDLWQREGARGLKLYVRRVFIMDDAEQFLPIYLRFIKGVVDSSDLPLNVSRELLQQDPEVEAIRSGLTKRALDMIGRLAKDEPQKYATFWKEFGAVLKEGVVQDPPNQAALLNLLRFASTQQAEDTPTVTLADYVKRMQPGQERIYFVTAESVHAARGHPAIERLRERNIEVLLMGERIDEWMMGQLTEFEGKRFKDAARGDLELGGLASAADKSRHDAELKESKGLLKRVKDALGERVSEVRVSERLRESPACLVLGEHDVGENLRRILAAAGQPVPAAHPVLELNVEHPLVKYLDARSDTAEFGELAQLLYEQSALAEGTPLANPPEYVQRLNRLLVRLAGTPSAAP